MTAPRTYARVYHQIVDDPKFARVYGDDAALATWLRLLLVADAMYPASGALPRRNRAVTLLLECGLIEERPGNRYIVHGLEAERERRSAIGRNAALVRHHSERNANAMPPEQSTAEQKKSNGANASEPGVFMGMRPKEPGIWNGAGAHDGRHGRGCRVCTPHPDRTESPGVEV